MTLGAAAALVLATGAAGLGTGVDAARAAFPGHNGRIAFSVERWRQPPGCPRDVPHGCDPVQYSSTIETVLPSGRARRVLRSFPVELSASAPQWSPDGRLLAFQQVSTLSTMRADGTGLRQLPRLTSGEATPTWSPNGARLAFTGSAICCNWLYTARPNGTGLRRVLAREALTPAWSVNGTIAFTSSRGLYTVRADGSRLRLLLGRRTGKPDWSPDGSRIAFSWRDRIFTVRPDGQGRRRLISGDNIASPSWSPDGRYIAFNRGGDLYVMRSSGRGVRRVVDARQPDVDPRHPWAQLSAPSWQPRP